MKKDNELEIKILDIEVREVEIQNLENPQDKNNKNNDKRINKYDKKLNISEKNNVNIRDSDKKLNKFTRNCQNNKIIKIVDNSNKELNALDWSISTQSKNISSYKK